MATPLWLIFALIVLIIFILYFTLFQNYEESNVKVILDSSSNPTLEITNSINFDEDLRNNNIDHEETGWLNLKISKAAQWSSAQKVSAPAEPMRIKTQVLASRHPQLGSRHKIDTLQRLSSRADKQRENFHEIEKENEISRDKEVWDKIDNAKHVTLLHYRNFEKFLKNSSSALVLFYDPTCWLCTKIMPEFSSAAAFLNEKLRGRVSLAAISGSSYNLISKKYPVRKYPTIVYYKKGLPKGQYNRPCDAQNFIDFFLST